MSLTILPNSIAGMIDSFKSTRASLVASRDANREQDLDNRFVIVVDGLVIDVDKIDSKGGMNAVCPVREAPYFTTYGQAAVWADRVVNGAGKRGEVWTLRQAYNDSIFRIDGIIATLEAQLRG